MVNSPDTGHTGIVDCDLHSVVPSAKVLFPYLSDYWQETITQTAFKGAPDTPYPPRAPHTARPGSAPPDGAAGTDLPTLAAQALDAWGTSVGILNCAYGIESIHNPDGAAALAAAVNDWHRAEWLAHEPRLRASILVPSRQPDAAAAEINRVGSDPGFVQVYLPVRSEKPYGDRAYHPLYAAAVAHDLVIGLHFGGNTGSPPTAAGWPSYYLEEYAGMAQVFQSQVFSMIAGGVFDRFPTLRVTLIEGGWTWLPSLMWRMDKEWKGLRREVPWVRKPPSEYVRTHFRLTLQPLDTPPDRAHVEQIMAQMEAEEMLLFASDYPHWHFDDPAEALPNAPLTDAAREKLMSGNARAWYRF